jgi:hypothetical protein
MYLDGDAVSAPVLLREAKQQRPLGVWEVHVIDMRSQLRASAQAAKSA